MQLTVDEGVLLHHGGGRVPGWVAHEVIASCSEAVSHRAQLARMQRPLHCVVLVLRVTGVWDKAAAQSCSLPPRRRLLEVSLALVGMVAFNKFALVHGFAANSQAGKQ